MEFEWDSEKARTNLAKHGVAFETAAEIFLGFTYPLAVQSSDWGEVREVTLGSTRGQVILTVVHTDREGRCRLISARRATAHERRIYHDAYSKNA